MLLHLQRDLDQKKNVGLQWLRTAIGLQYKSIKTMRALSLTIPLVSKTTRNPAMVPLFVSNFCRCSSVKVAEHLIHHHF